MNKRDAVLSLTQPGQIPPYIPAAFFLHFEPAYHRGQAAVDKHLEYFRYTGMDFVKIQYEHTFPKLPYIQKPTDWQKMPLYGKDFFAEPLKVVEGLVKAAKNEALVMVTLYSPFMCAEHATSQEILTAHLLENPDMVKEGIEIVTESLRNFVRGCIDAGVDGFYHSTQGGEAGRFPDQSIFLNYIKPYDLSLMNEIDEKCIFNILHICDYVMGYDDLTAFLDYPGHIVNASLHLGERKITAQEVNQMFNRPFMGGLERKGAISSGPADVIQVEVEKMLETVPSRFILGADCTVLGGTSWDNLRLAIDLAHQYNK